MTFVTFVQSLQRDIDWDRHGPSDVERLEVLIRTFASDQQVLAAAVRDLLARGETFDQYLPHMEYPRPFMDKFVLHMDPEDRFRIRLHRFRAGVMVGLASDQPTVHDHRWPFTSMIVRGSYTERLFDVQTSKQGSTGLRQTGSRLFAAGDVNSLSPGILHQTVNEATLPCLTLFVRGRSALENSRVWDPKTSGFRPLLGRREQIAAQLEAVAAALLSNDPLLGTAPGAYS